MYYIVFYCIVGPLSPTIHSGLEWPQFLNSLIYSPHPPLKEENVGRGGEKEEDEEKEVPSSFHSLCSLSVGKFSPFHSFHFISFISNSKIFAVNSFHSFQFLKYSLYWHRTHKTSLRVKKTIPESMPCIVAHSTRRYIGTAVGPLHPALHRNGA